LFNVSRARPPAQGFLGQLVSNTWISLTERPPPATVTEPRLLLRFRSKLGDDCMGYYLGDGKVRILGHSIRHQLPLTLDEIESWQAVNNEQLREIEDAEEDRDIPVAETPTDQRHGHRGNAAPGSGRHREPPQDGIAAPLGFEDLEDPAEWADFEQETAPGTDRSGGTGDSIPGQ
jgi:hypothetical protein